MRPLKQILSSPHIMGGFLGYHNNTAWKIENHKVKFLKNPIHILNTLYTYLDLEDHPLKPACDKIWDHDRDIISEALEFYRELEELEPNFEKLDYLLRNSENSPQSTKIPKDIWEKCRHSHNAFQLGLDLLKIIPAIGHISQFLEIDINDNLEAVVPEKFTNSATIQELVKGLNPPPKAKSDEIIAPMGGMFYSREAPNLPPLAAEGDSFKAGQPLFIIEVMKMFNKISVPFHGKIVKHLMKDSDGKIVTKGQAIFKVLPDEIVKEESPEEILAKQKSVLNELMKY